MKTEPAILDAINAVLKVEWTASEAYADQAACFAALGLTRLASKWWEEVEEERTHVRRLLERLAFLEGEATDEHAGWPESDADPHTDPAQAVVQYLAADLDLETQGLEGYRAGIDLARRHGDETTALIFAQNLKETEEHILMLEGFQRSIKAAGLDNWLSAWL